MDKDEYFQTQWQLVLQAQLIIGLDLDGFLAAIEQAESFGPILDPTLFIQGGKRLEEVKRLALAAKKFSDEAQRQIREGKLHVGVDYAKQPAFPQED